MSATEESALQLRAELGAAAAPGSRLSSAGSTILTLTFSPLFGLLPQLESDARLLEAPPKQAGGGGGQGGRGWPQQADALPMPGFIVAATARLARLLLLALCLPRSSCEGPPPSPPRQRVGPPRSQQDSAEVQMYGEGAAAPTLWVRHGDKMLSGGTHSVAAVGRASAAAAHPRPSSTEVSGMLALFDDLDSDNDMHFEQAELSGMLRQLGLASKRDRVPAAHQRSWAAALRKMDGNSDEMLSKLEVVDHMKALVLTKRQVADWLTFGLGLGQYAEAFVKNSITGHDLPSLLEEADVSLSSDASVSFDGDDILQYDLGVTLSLHRRQIRRGVAALIFGAPPPQPTGLKCEGGEAVGSVLVSWQGETEIDEEDVTYRLRRQNSATRSWTTVGALDGVLGYLDTELDTDPELSYTYERRPAFLSHRGTYCYRETGLWEQVQG
eukprot:COSAG04_NODE_135_length_23774_cov_40.993918_1_plen_440_part_00